MNLLDINWLLPPDAPDAPDATQGARRTFHAGHSFLCAPRASCVPVLLCDHERRPGMAPAAPVFPIWCILFAINHTHPPFMATHSPLSNLDVWQWKVCLLPYGTVGTARCPCWCPAAVGAPERIHACSICPLDGKGRFLSIKVGVIILHY